MSGTMKKKLPIGIENFRDIRTENFYYVDKTAMIRELLQRWAKVNLFTRPRRFGKSLNMSMLRSFFEIGEDPSLFEGLAISRETELCQAYMGQFPVVSISLKGVDAANYQTARNLAVKAINEEARRLRYLLDSDQLAPEDKILFSQFLDKDMADETLVCSLRELCELLEKHFGKKVILLIDEYNVPLAKAHEQGYYDPMVFLIRNLFSQALKTNDSLYFAVLTGCLRVDRESIFTGLNNVKTLSITSFSFDEYFGFTDFEVQEMLQYYGAENKYEMVKNWYDGYRFGKVDVYCPWDVIRYCDELQDNPDAEPQNYWSNTSSNDVVRHFLQQVDQGLTKSEMEALIAGEAVTKEISEELTYNHLYDSIDHLWSVLFATGYLTYRGKGSGNTYQLAIPNQEIRSIFTEQIMTLFKEAVARDGESLAAFCDALQAGNAAEVESCFSAYLAKTIRIRDTFRQRPSRESFFHGILLGILSYKNGWYVRSNQEAGEGYSDILIQVEGTDIGMILEVKYAENGQFDAACREALQQIEEKNYAQALRSEGCRVILQYGIACFRKRCRVMVEREEYPEV